MGTPLEKPVEKGPSISIIRNPTYLKDGVITNENPKANESFGNFLEQEKAKRPTKELILDARKYLLETYQEPSWKKGFEKDYFVIPYLIREVDGHSRIIHIGRMKKPGAEMPGNFVTAFDAPELKLKIIGAENGIATNIEIQDTKGNKLPILAVKYPVSKTLGFQDYVYTPYTEALRSPELIAEGQRYMTQIITQGALDVESIHWIKPEVRDIGPKIIRGLMITESMDPSKYPKLTDNEVQKLMQEQITQFYTLLGANDEIAFRRVSGAGARGIVQVIARTFYTLIERFPHAHVHNDFEEGTKHHRSSVILAYGHLQMEYTTYESNKLVHAWISGPGKGYLPYLLAAGYNSNNAERTKELATVLKHHSDKKPEEIFGRFIGAFGSEGVRNETIPYLKKFAFVMRNHFGYPLPLLPEAILETPEEKSLPKKEGKKKK